MSFLKVDQIVFLLLLTVIGAESRLNHQGLLMNRSQVFKFHHINQCKSNEFYDMDYFTCLPCNDDTNSKLQLSFDKLTCQCAPTSVTIALYDTAIFSPLCVQACSSTNRSNALPSNAVKISSHFNDTENALCLPATKLADATRSNCNFKYINFTNDQVTSTQPETTTRLRITGNNPNPGENCTFCNLKYNLHYEDFCISAALIKPYLNYNGYWQQTSTINGQYGDLKFVAFFCLALHNASACIVLANLCVISFYSLEMNSPCSPFLLTQTSESLLRYAHLDEHLKQLRPFLFYKKGKQTKALLTEPVKDAKAYSLRAEQGHSDKNLLRFFVTVFALDGSLKRWGTLRSSHVNLCQLYNRGSRRRLNYMDESEEFHFGVQNAEETCHMSLENIIDLATIYGNKYFFNIYLNFTTENNTGQTFLQSVPVLIENLSPENRSPDIEEWQLVKRFQLFKCDARFVHGSRTTPDYEDAHKLMLYRTIRYVDKFQLHYNILEGNRIAIPLIKLHYRSIEFVANSSLDHDFYTFQFRVHFTSVKESLDGHNLGDNILGAVFLLIALIATVLRTYNFRRRRRHQQQQQQLAAGMDLCDVPCLVQLSLTFISNMANTFLAFFLIHISYRLLIYVTQDSVAVTLAKDCAAIYIIYAALILKFVYLCFHFWRLCHIDLFFIDWERPRTCDINHFNVKNNLETSSVCSSVRTLISENNVSAWRTFSIANEWIALSGKQQTSVFIQCILSLICFNLFGRSHVVEHDATFQLLVLVAAYIMVFLTQFLLRQLVVNRIFGHPLQRFVDTCSLANISVLGLSESAYGFYIHGRSPHGFADTDISSILLQLERESQNMCGRRGLLSDSDHQTFVVLPPHNLRMYCDSLLSSLQKSCNISQAYLKNEAARTETNLEKRSIAYNSVNRFLCAFVDHAIRDMDYIIKEKTFMEKLLNMEFDYYLTKNKGTFYIDKNFAFSQTFLYGNAWEILVMELLFLPTFYLITENAMASVVAVCILNKLFQQLFRYAVKQNMARKALIDPRFLK